jgi:4'-phosphopantetheinyl transferase
VVVTVWLAAAGADARGAAYALLGYAAGAELGVPAEDVEVTREPGGRPVLAGAGAGLHVGLSHTRGTVAVVTSRIAPVGVDVEAVRPLPCAALSRRWLLPEEADWVRGHGAERQTVAFLLLWTYKEAVGKARGTGLRGGGLRRPAPLRWPAADGPVLAPAPGDATMAAGTATRPELVLAVACASAAAGGVPVDLRAVG